MEDSNLTVSELNALVKLLEDPDKEISEIVRAKIKSVGEFAIPILEQQKEEVSDGSVLYNQIINILNEIKFNNLEEKITDWKENRNDDLLEGLYLVSSYIYPKINLYNLRQEINLIYFDAWVKLGDNLHPEDSIRILNNVFFDKYKFRPNTKHFHSSENSLINKVLETKKGNPILLCSIYLIIAQKLNLPIYGVNFPSLFLLTYLDKHLHKYINVFNNGLVISKSEVLGYLEQMNIKYSSVYMDPCTNVDIVKRTLLNLKYSLKKEGKNAKSEDIDILLNIL